MIKLVVSDMDGTLINKKCKISDKNVEAIHRLLDNNIEFALASGRDYNSVVEIMKQYDIQCESILGNGAQYRDKNGNVLMSCYMNKNVVKDVVAILEEKNAPYMIITTNGVYTGQEPSFVRNSFIKRGGRKFGSKPSDYEKGGFVENTPVNFLVKIDDYDEFLEKDLEIIKIETFSLEPNEVLDIQKKLKDIQNIAYLSSFDDNIEITDQYAQKGLILEKVIKLKGLSKEEVIVLGDGMNDLTMFEHFPYSYAPNNAEETIKNLAHIVVNDCDDDGFSEAIYLMFNEFYEE